MQAYNKLIAAVVGLVLLFVKDHLGVDLTGNEAAIVEAVIAIGTALAVYLVPNTPKQPPTDGGETTSVLAIALICGALVMLLAGCVATPAKTPKESVAACYFTVRAAFGTAADLRTRGQLSDAQRANVLKLGDQALASCDAARLALAQGDTTTAQGQLKLAEGVLLQLEAALAAKEGK